VRGCTATANDKERECAVAESDGVVDVVGASERRGKRSPKSGGRAELKHMSLERPRAALVLALDEQHGNTRQHGRARARRA
jgi:hypothetical protein